MLPGVTAWPPWRSGRPDSLSTRWPVHLAARKQVQMQMTHGLAAFVALAGALNKSVKAEEAIAVTPEARARFIREADLARDMVGPEASGGAATDAGADEEGAEQA